MEVYLDIVVILNFLVDFLLLLGTNRLSGFPLSPLRCALAASLGALYSALCFLRGFRFLSGTLWRLVSLGGMGAVAFGLGQSARKRCGVFVILSMALGGVTICFGRGDFFGLLLGAGLVWGLCRLAFGETVGGREYVPLELHYGDTSLNLTALRDSGNTLRDPVTGEQVLVIDRESAIHLTGLTETQLASPVETLAKGPIRGLRLIPYRAVGQSGGMLLALRLPKVKIGDRTQSAVVAFAPEGLGGSMYQALSF